MPLDSIFVFREQVTESILQLLENTTLGTNGAKYRHLDTGKRIQEIDNPLFLTVERHQKAIGNVTFCRRGKAWYIRYFAFDKMFQANKQKKNHKEKHSHFKEQLEDFFQEKLDPNSPDSIDSFYAYIDPNNAKSMWMAENFGFHTVGKLMTQSFSRIRPVQSIDIEQCFDRDVYKKFIGEKFGTYVHFQSNQHDKGCVYVSRDEFGEIIAFAKISHVHWKIERLPGFLGGFLVRFLPFIPFLNKIIHPNNHQFIVPESVYIKNNNPELMEQFFESMLKRENRNLILWWVDQNELLYTKVRHKMHWGILNRLVGVNAVHVVERTKAEIEPSASPFFVRGIDLV